MERPRFPCVVQQRARPQRSSSVCAIASPSDILSPPASSGWLVTPAPLVYAADRGEVPYLCCCNKEYFMRRFQLKRQNDLTGISGTGIIAQGVEVEECGLVLLQWPKHNTTLGVE